MITENILLTQDHLFTLQGFLYVINHAVIHHLSHADDTAAPVWCINSDSSAVICRSAWVNLLTAWTSSNKPLNYWSGPSVSPRQLWFPLISDQYVSDHTATAECSNSAALFFIAGLTCEGYNRTVWRFQKFSECSCCAAAFFFYRMSFYHPVLRSIDQGAAFFLGYHLKNCTSLHQL